jgi:hypothetical protein
MKFSKRDLKQQIAHLTGKYINGPTYFNFYRIDNPLFIQFTDRYGQGWEVVYDCGIDEDVCYCSRTKKWLVKVNKQGNNQ